MDSFPAFLEMSSATNEVAILRRGMLNTFDTMLNIEIETPADANSKGPFQHKFKSSSSSEVGEENGKATETCSVRVGVLIYQTGN